LKLHELVYLLHNLCNFYIYYLCKFTDFFYSVVGLWNMNNKSLYHSFKFVTRSALIGQKSSRSTERNFPILLVLKLQSLNEDNKILAW